LNDRKLTVGSLIMNNFHSSENKSENNQDNSLTKSTKSNKVETSTEQRKILISQNRTTFSVTPVKEKTLLDSALKQGQSLQYKCKKGTCGRCMVQILKGKDQLNSPNDQEISKLNEFLEDDYRLACQTLFT
jgi:2Fe-2S ferredoxin